MRLKTNKIYIKNLKNKNQSENTIHDKIKLKD